MPRLFTAFQTFAPHRNTSNMNMDLQAASIGIDLNEEDPCHDAEEAEEPLDHGMKAIAANNDMKDDIEQAKSGGAGASVTPELSVRTSSPK